MKKYIFILLALLLVFSCGKKEGDKKEGEDVTKTEEQRTDTAVAGESEVEAMEKEVQPQNKSESGLWEAYNKAKAASQKAIEAGNYKVIKRALNDAAKYAHELKRPIIEAWQYNNIAYYCIEEFKERTKYDFRMKQLGGMKPGPDRDRYNKETEKLFSDNFHFLNEATDYLKKAQFAAGTLLTKELKNKIRSNTSFIDQIKLLLS
ncbi:hypothetical protein JXI42_02045 [bacterium]|nr:hypothetical protein [bacterium]